MHLWRSCFTLGAEGAVTMAAAKQLVSRVYPPEKGQKGYRETENIQMTQAGKGIPGLFLSR